VSVTVTKPRVGFLGLGWIGRARFEALVSSHLVEIGPVADPALPESYESLDELLEEKLDGIVIATPSALHAEQAIEILQRGVSVFCQKPLARTAEETRAVVDAAREGDRLLRVDFSYRFADAFRVARDVVLSGELGETVAADLVFHNAYGPDNDWSHDPLLAGGGCLIDLGIHLLDLAVWTFDLEPQLVSSRMFGAPVETLVTAELDRLRLACSWNLHAGCAAVIEMSVYGTDGGVSVRNIEGSFYDFRCDRYRGTHRETLSLPPDDWGGRAIVDWARRLAHSERFDPSAEDYVRVAELIDRVYRA
jgi:predicted dehydrogenase